MHDKICGQALMLLLVGISNCIFYQIRKHQSGPITESRILCVYIYVCIGVCLVMQDFVETYMVYKKIALKIENNC